jgi:hypothetical protein
MCAMNTVGRQSFRVSILTCVSLNKFALFFVSRKLLDPDKYMLLRRQNGPSTLFNAEDIFHT